MTDKERMKWVQSWAKYVKENPGKWRKQLNPFIDSQINKANQFYKKLEKTPGGKEKIKKILQQRNNKTTHTK